MVKNGFTLVELMVVVVVIGILAAFGMPKFQSAADKAKAAEALPILSAIAGAQESYRIAHGEYLKLDDDEDDENWKKVGLKFPEQKYFKYVVVDVAAGTLDAVNPFDNTLPKFTAKAILIRNLSRAKKDEEITVNQEGVKTASTELKRLVPSFFAGQ
jgi:prepilin-type N-terminal cleavage/methylation domain-containing protein